MLMNYVSIVQMKQSPGDHFWVNCIGQKSDGVAWPVWMTACGGACRSCGHVWVLTATSTRETQGASLIYNAVSLAATSSTTFIPERHERR